MLSVVTLSMNPSIDFHRGSLLVTRDEAWRADALPIKPVSTVGAGDSFLGGMVFGLASGHNLGTAFRYGNAAGSAAVLAPGTELCRVEDVERHYDRVVVHTLADNDSIAASSTAQEP